jgi:hypothetical protein
MPMVEDVYARCPYCDRVVMNTESDDTIREWITFHVTNKLCVS